MDTTLIKAVLYHKGHPTPRTNSPINHLLTECTNQNIPFTHKHNDAEENLTHLYFKKTELSALNRESFSHDMNKGVDIILNDPPHVCEECGAIILNYRPYVERTVGHKLIRTTKCITCQGK